MRSLILKTCQIFADRQDFASLHRSRCPATDIGSKQFCFLNHLAVIVRESCLHKILAGKIHCGPLMWSAACDGRIQFFFVVHLTLSFRLSGMRNFDECLTRTPGPVIGSNLQNNRLQRVLLLPLELSKPAQAVQVSTKKIGKEKRKWNTIYNLNLEPWLRWTRRPRPGKI